MILTHFYIQDDINRKCTRMGGKPCDNLMNSVTHLIVNLPANRKVSPKYNYAFRKRSDVMFLDVEFIPKLYDRWTGGEDIEIAEELRQYGNRKMFKGYTISLSGLVEPERSQAIHYIQENGGNYTSNLTAKTDILVSISAKGQKFEFAKQRKIKTVSSLWLDASRKRGAFAPIELFSYDLTEEQWHTNLQEIVDKIYDDVYVPTSVAVSLEQEAIKQQRKLPTKLTRTKSDSTWNSMMLHVTDISSVPQASDATSVQDSVKAVGEAPFEIIAEDDASRLNTIDESNGSDVDKEAQLFEGHILYFYGFSEEKVAKIEPFVTSRGAAVMKSMDGPSLPTHIVIEHKLPPSDLPSYIPDSVTVVTDWYLDLSIFHKELVPPSTNKYSAYLGHEVYSPEVSEFQSKQIEISCFDGMHRTHIERLLAMLGAKYTGTLDYNCDLLIVPLNVYDQIKKPSAPLKPMTGIRSLAKISYARQWGIPIIPDEWLLDRKFYAKIGKAIVLAKGKKPPPLQVQSVANPKRKAETKESIADEKPILMKRAARRRKDN